MLKPTLLPTLTLLLTLALQLSVLAADVSVELLSREAYVGSPIDLVLTIKNAESFEAPTPPVIADCEVVQAGEPSRVSQQMILPGRQWSNQSVSYVFRITPQRTGKFQVPPLELVVDGKQVKTDTLTFFATQSETGDLLFVEIVGAKEKVYVGEALDLKMKIWLKPYRDRDYKVTLSEGDMWGLFSEKTNWGGFRDKLQELDRNSQRPGGREVLRKDKEGIERNYYLYEISTTIYPKRPGRIDTEEVRVVVDYPTKLSKARDSIGFGGSSLQSMLEDEFFSAPFRDRLVISGTRPLIASAQISATEVVPVPTDGRPDDYRGAVGRYRIATQATPTSVAAGDPITLSIGVAGTGPLELLQAPPLASLKSMTSQFKVADESLAGYVHEGTKIFSTTIRPLTADVTEIPAIPLSFFDPETEAFETVWSEPISIHVEKADMLAIDAVVSRHALASGSEPVAQGTQGTGEQGTGSQESPRATAGNLAISQPDFTNNFDTSVLRSQPRMNWAWWWIPVAVPPALWCLMFCLRVLAPLGKLFPNIRTPRSLALAAIERSQGVADVESAVMQYIARRTKQPCTNSATSVGALRTTGLYAIANEVENYFLKTEAAHERPVSEAQLHDLKAEARHLLSSLEVAFAASTKEQVRRPQARGGQAARASGSGRKAESLSCLLLALIGTSFGNVAAAEDSQFQLSPVQLETLFKDANALYAQAEKIAAEENAKPKDAESNKLFTAAAKKYQLIVEGGVSNAQLFINLGNAYFRSNQIGRAIVNYERARALEPDNLQAMQNLAALQKELANAPDSSLSVSALQQRTSQIGSVIFGRIGYRNAITLLSLMSCLFWGLLMARFTRLKPRLPLAYAVLPGLLFVALLALVLSQSLGSPSDRSAVLLADSVSLRSSDGLQFAETAVLNRAVGRRVEVLSERGSWAQVRTSLGQVGWVEGSELERIF